MKVIRSPSKHPRYLKEILIYILYGRKSYAGSQDSGDQKSCRIKISDFFNFFLFFVVFFLELYQSEN